MAELIKDPKDHVIMTKTLPNIIDGLAQKEEEFDKKFLELEALIKATKQAAADAKRAGEEAAETANKAAAKLIDELKKDYDAQIAELEGRLDGHDQAMDAAGGAMKGPAAARAARKK